MDKIKELKAKIEEIIGRMKSVLDKADEEKRDLTEEETASYEAMERDIDVINKDIERRMKLLEEEARAAQVIDPLHLPNTNRRQFVKPKEFSSLGEYFFTIRSNPNDPRLMEFREMQMGTGASGGYALPDQFLPEIKQVQPQEAIVRPRATVIPPGDPPDAKLTMPALDQTSGGNVYGGVIITHTGEAVNMTETSVGLKEVEMEPKEMTAYIVVTDKLLANWGACDAFIRTQLRKAMAGAEDYDFMRGDGINKSLGFINAPAALTHTRSAANTIAFADVYGMFAKAKQSGNLAWVVSQTTIPQLVTIVDAGSHAIWVGGGNLNQGIAGPLPPTLFGLPVYFAERLPALGTKGDINLVDLSYYLIKDGSGPYVALSDQLLFLSNRTVFKIRWNVDARPWLTEPIGLEGSTSNTVSPFVNLS